MPPSDVNVPGDYFSLAGFEVTTYGRFWVTPEVHTSSLFRSGRGFQQLTNAQTLRTRALLGFVQRCQLHPSGNRRVSSSVNENFRYFEGAAASDLSQRSVTNEAFIMSIGVRSRR